MGTPFQSLTAPPAIGYGTKNVPPPAALAVSTNDQLLIRVRNSNAAPLLHVFARLLLPDGTVVPNDWAIVPDATRAVNSFTFPLDEGFLLSAAVVATAAGVTRGQCYVQVVLLRGNVTQNFQGYLLTEGYVSNTTALGFPGGPSSYAFEGRGTLRSIGGTTPAAGAEISETVPTAAIWRLISFRYTLVTSAAVANRLPQLLISDGANTLAQVGAAVSIAAGVTTVFSYAQGVQAVASQNGQTWCFLPFSEYLSAGFKIQTLTAAIQAADQYSAVQYLVEEWIQQ